MLFVAYSVSLYYFGQVSVPKITLSAQDTDKNQGVADKIQKPLPQNETVSARVLAQSVKLCASTVNSFELAYPKDWFTTYNQKDQECAFFAPYSFVIPTSLESDFTQVTIKVINKDQWEEVVKSFENPNELYNIDETKNIDVNGKLVKFIKSQSTGSLKPRGFKKVTYLVFDTNHPLEITYTQLDEKEDTKNYEVVLENMVQSLKFY